MHHKSGRSSPTPRSPAKVIPGAHRLIPHYRPTSLPYARGLTLRSLTPGLVSSPRTPKASQPRSSKSRWDCTAALLWQSTWMRSVYSPKPSRVLISTTQISVSRTPLASMTKFSFRSSTPAPWKTQAVSPSAMSMYSLRKPATTCMSAARIRSCTSLPTCGSATWSPCSGGMTCG